MESINMSFEGHKSRSEIGETWIWQGNQKIPSTMINLKIKLMSIFGNGNGQDYSSSRAGIHPKNDLHYIFSCSFSHLRNKKIKAQVLLKITWSINQNSIQGTKRTLGIS